MDPAFHIALTMDEKVALGELVAIQGQIEELLEGTASFAWGQQPGGPYTGPRELDEILFGTLTLGPLAKLWRRA